MSTHDDRVREQFRLQAETFDDRGFAVAGLEELLAVADPQPHDVVLDVAAGAVHVGRALAPHVGHVCALDLTPEMLAQGRRLADEQGVRNLTTALGDATAMPWTGDQFDLVACRLTLHQVADPAAVVAEMVRVARPGGRVLVVDMEVDADPTVAAESNRLEILRDPSHGRTLDAAEVGRLLEDAGAEVERVDRRDNVVDLEDWLDRTQTPADARAEVLAAFEAELAGGPRTGLRPHRTSSADGTDRLAFVHVWMSVLARA